MPRPVDEMIGELRGRWTSAHRDETTPMRARDLASRLPLVHRTGQVGRRWQSIFQEGQLAGVTPGTRWEREMLGLDKAVYFFWGCGAYPKGTVALLLEGMPPGIRCTATPFDSGGCGHGYFLQAGLPLSEDEIDLALDRFTLDDGARVSEYGAHYIADLFDDPLDYVRLPQQAPSQYPPIHDLASPTDDRRAWSIEVRFHGDVPVPPEQLRKVVLKGRDRFLELPSHYRRIAAVSAPEDDFDQAIAKEVLS